jgi:hypothetical protein
MIPSFVCNNNDIGLFFGPDELSRRITGVGNGLKKCPVADMTEKYLRLIQYLNEKKVSVSGIYRPYRAYRVLVNGLYKNVRGDFYHRGAHSHLGLAGPGHAGCPERALVPAGTAIG